MIFCSFISACSFSGQVYSKPPPCYVQRDWLSRYLHPDARTKQLLISSKALYQPCPAAVCLLSICLSSQSPHQIINDQQKHCGVQIRWGVFFVSPASFSNPSSSHVSAGTNPEVDFKVKHRFQTKKWKIKNVFENKNRKAKRFKIFFHLYISWTSLYMTIYVH